MSIEQGAEAEPQVFAAAQIPAGLAAEQTSPLIFFFVSWPTMRLVTRIVRMNRKQQIIRFRYNFISAPHFYEMSDQNAGQRRPACLFNECISRAMPPPKPGPPNVSSIAI